MSTTTPIEVRLAGGGVAVAGLSFGSDPRDGPGVGVSGNSDVGIAVNGISQQAWGVAGISTATDGVYGSGRNGVHGHSASATDSGVWGENSGNGYGVAGSSAHGTGVYGKGQPAGHFDGDVNVQGNFWASGTITAGQDIVLAGNDCAEEFDLAADTQPEPGTVMVLDGDGRLRPSQRAYDKRVAGVVSGAGEYRPGLILGKQPSSDRRVALGLVGRVFCKVDARYGPIEVGDLLTTSPTAGHAMKAADPAAAFGAVLGKALRSLPSGVALVPVLVALQ